MISVTSGSELKEYYDVMLCSYKDAASRAGFPARGRAGNFTYEDLIAARESGDMLFHKRIGEKIVGVARVKINGGTCKISDIAVMPGHQQRGHGRELLDFIKTRARELGAHRIELGMFDDNALLKQWYETNGFKPIETRTYADSPFVIGIMECAL